jgi:hypothetical protein
MLVPTGEGAFDRRHAALFRGAAMVVLGLTVAFLLVQGEIRTVLMLLLVFLGLLCLSPRRGTYILLTFLPFMYFIRRQILHFNEFASRDPILLFPPLVTIAMIFGIIVFSGDRVFRYVTRSALLKTILALLVLFVVQVFNPVQGSILIGIAGGLYFVIPMLWVFMGLLIEERDVRRIFGLIVLIGTVTALYGVYQHYFGLSAVEQYELESKGFVKTFGEKPRIMSTFAGLSDFSLYMATTGVICFAYYWNARKNLIYLVLLALTSFAILWTASRTSFLILAFALISFLIVNSKHPRQVLGRGVVALIAVAALYVYLYSYSPVEVYEAHGSNNPFIAHTISGVAHPTQESTFQKRLLTWRYVVGRGFLEYPFGRGLGSTTTAAGKFSEGKGFTVDSFFFELIYGSSPLAAILFIVVMVLFLRAALSLSLRFRDNLVYKIIIAILSGYFLGSIFGYSIRDTISGPLAWLLIGWTVREYVDRSEETPVVTPGTAISA